MDAFDVLFDLVSNPLHANQHAILMFCLVVLVALFTLGFSAFFLNWALHLVGMYDSRIGKALLVVCVAGVVMALGSGPLVLVAGTAGLAVNILEPLVEAGVIMLVFRTWNPVPALGAVLLSVILPVVVLSCGFMAFALVEHGMNLLLR